MKRKTKTIVRALLILLIISLLFLILFYSNYSRVLGEKDLFVDMEISNISSFNISYDALRFGRVRYGTSSQKEVVVDNSYKFPIKVEVIAQGNISNLLVFEKEHIVDVGKNKSIDISTIVPTNEAAGYYSGKLRFIFKKFI